MWKKVVGLSLVGVALVILAVLGYLYLRNPAMAPPARVSVEATEARLARGKYLFDQIGACNDCHGERDFTRFGGPVKNGAKGSVLPPELGFPGTVVAPNITPDKETGIGNWSDGEKIRAIREGVGRDGQALFPLMPYQNFREMSDEDVYSLVAYLNTLEPIRSALPRTKINFPVSLLIKSVPKPAGSVPPVNRGNIMEYGKYLVAMGGCENCHTPRRGGKPVEGRFLAGGGVFRTPFGTVVSPNITPDDDTGIGKWTDQDFLNKFYQYRRYVQQGSPKVGPEGFTLMPWLAFCQLPEEDLKAIFAFLKAQPSVYNGVETHPANLQPTVSSDY